MIDLHMHTTASDGRLGPAELVRRVAEAGLTTIAVTDHDTTEAIDDVAILSLGHGIRVVPGVEITSVDEGRDVHLLAYFIDHRGSDLQAFLARQRATRIDRVREIGTRLAALGVRLDVDALIRRAHARPGTAIGRPWLARALVRAGHVESTREAFDRWLGQGQAAYVPRVGPPPVEVLAAVHAAGGLVSFAHPGVTRRDSLLGRLVGSGLDAIEVYHSDHAPEVREHYRSLAVSLGLALTGGSDFHGFGETRAALGVVQLPAEAFEELESRAAARAARTRP